ncbi:fatty acid synthase [Aeromicrobium panaciterrae]|uniref:Fatty acid synthase n=1 Tax=Aeromicrobium panaciterrae TaxID=363861 RepID=A0ABU1UMS1_9ACTN|nr:polyketide synthase [Aeromicrobium panaciterrae]MDR7086477.1 fatty acid synthase [Aeromicrobium panaciterrae]
MTTIDTSLAPTRTSERRGALVDRIVDGAPYAVGFGGQGASWLEPLADLVRDFALEADLEALVSQAEAKLVPVAGELARAGITFTPLAWVDVLAVGESAEDDDAPELPDTDMLGTPGVSLPGILLTQLAGIRALHRQGIDTQVIKPSAVIGHSQGLIAAQSLAGVDDVELLAIARLVGAAGQLVGRRRGLLGNSMLSISNVRPERIDEILAELPASLRVVARMRNGRRSVVISGPASSLHVVQAHLEEVAAAEKAERDRKTTGGTPFAPVIEPLTSQLAFHHPDLAEAADLVATWATACGIDAERARDLAKRSLVDPVDWVESLETAMNSGATWILDLGPGDIAARLSARELRTRGVGIIATTTRRGHRELVAAGAAPRLATPWSAYAPSVVTLPDGSIHAETRFTRLTGKSPILLAGMTPTTVDAKIVAAAANAGFWAELAGGGQVTEPIFADRVAELNELLTPGSTFQFNSLFLDPYLWKLQLGQKRLVQRARAAGAPIDAVIVTAGIPELEEAVALVSELRDADITHVVFKPGTVKQIRQVVAIAKEVAPTPIIVQIEGGKAGGHHSWEDLDDLLLATYGELRALDNVVVCVGGGIGTPEVAAAYLSGEWARRHDFPLMPLDGILVGTAAMATLEATTAPDVKQLLVDTRGTGSWIGAGTAKGGMASSLSQLGADIHEIDNTASRTGHLLDEVAGDAEAVAERRDEIIDALNRTAKPYFGDVATMTYAQWLSRFLELSGTPTWLDITMQERFTAMLQRAEARLHSADRGTIPTLFANESSVAFGATALDVLLRAYPEAAEVTLHPGDVLFFVDQCKTPGKPVNFVPVLDQDVRRWWRSDSLWQAHDARYGADQVCVIPGPVSVGGIDRVDEPVAELLRRFEDATIDGLLASGRAPQRVAGRRRVDGAGDVLSLVLAAPDLVWAGRTVRNPVHRLGADWVIVDPERAEHPETGATVIAIDARTAELHVPLARPLSLRIDLGDAVVAGAAPVVTTEIAAEAMGALVAGAAGGTVPKIADGHATVSVDWDPDLIADHAGVTGADVPVHPVPDVLVGLAWPSVFAVLGDVTTADGIPVIEGMLDLVHLDHAVTLVGALPTAPAKLTIGATVESVSDTDYGRVVTVDVTVTSSGNDIANLRERFAIRGRTGAGELADPARAGGALGEDVQDTPRKSRGSASVVAPTDLRAFAAVTGDHNPIHTSIAAARLAGLGDPIVHGMWVSAAAQQIVSGRRITGWTTRFMAPVRPGATVDVRADRVGLDAGAEVLDISCRVEGEVVMAATARLEAPRTAYAFPGQGIQHAGMGMAAYARSKAAREIWDRADAHTREALGFSILNVVRDNPTVLVAQGVTHKHPDGVLFLTQFTQVAMAVLGAAQMAELREAGAFVEGSILAGHSVGEYNALAAVSGVIALEGVVEVVFQRGSVMHTLVERDAEGRSDYRLAAIRPSQIGLVDDNVKEFVDGIAEQSGEFLQIVNYNLRDSQYAIAGTVRGLEILETAVNKRRDEFGGKGAFILIPGIDVPFHSTVLRGGVPDFRARLDELLPPTIDPAILAGRYVPNLVPKPFSLDRAFIQEIADLVPSEPLDGVLADFAAWSKKPGELCRVVLIELLAWQFASPVRWIETQDLMFGELGVERFIEVGVGQAPTVANLASQTLKLPGRHGGPVEVLNFERDSAAVFSTDEEMVEFEEDEAVVEMPTSDAASPSVQLVTSMTTSGPRPADITFDAADATTVLIAWWTKMRIDQIGAADSIESLCDGASSRRNQLLVDLGGELGLGAIDGAADADLPTLSGQVKGLARGYKAFGQVLTEALGDHLKKVLGPTGKRQAYVAERVTDVWQLEPGWASHVLAELAMSSREGASVRGGDFGSLSGLATGADVDAAIDASVAAVASRHGVSVDLPSTGGGEATIDAAAMAEFTSQITGPDGVLASAARLVLDQLGLNEQPIVAEPNADDAEILARVESELGSDWAKLTAPAFDSDKAVQLDDRWASAREDLARIVHGDNLDVSFVGAGKALAAQAQWHATNGDPARKDRFAQIATDALTEPSAPWAGETAVVTGASQGSIAAGITGQLLAGGATVVATTSGLDPKRLAFYRELYRTHAINGAALWVVPANMASFADVDALTEWIGAEQTQTRAGTTTVLKPAMTPTLLFPFAAGRVAGDMSDVGSRTEIDMRVLLWSVERLITSLSAHGQDHDIDATLHVVIPGSPNRGMFGGDGGYGEAKAALDALVTRWKAEPAWANRVSLSHAIIGWVRGTGLMGGNDPLVEAVEAAGVRTWTPDEMAAALLETCTAEARAAAHIEPQTVDLTGGLGGVNLDMRALAEGVERPAVEAEDETGMIAALAPSPAQLDRVDTLDWAPLEARPEDLVVMVGAGELGPYGSSRTRFEVEVTDELSAAGILELAWTTGLVAWDTNAGGWYDTASQESVDEADLADRYEEAVREACGIRRYVDEGNMVDNAAPLLTSVFLDKDLSFTVSNESEAKALRDADPERTVIAATADGDWTVTRKAGTEIRVPRRLKLTRTVGGQIPTGFDPTVWGIPAEMVESIDRVGLWNLVCTVDAFLSSGFEPSELMRWVHPAMVANTQGTGMGGMQSMQSLYLDTLLGENKANDILQEALPNVIAAHVVQSYVGSYGAMVHPVAACATTAVSVEEGVDKIKLGKADFVVAGGFDDLSVEGIVGFADMSATADSAAMKAKGIEDRYFSRGNDRRYGGFVESQGGGTILLARGDVAARMGLPVLAVVAYAGSFADGVHTSIPAPGIGALAAGRGGRESALAKSLAQVGLTADDIGVLSKHDTSTGVNERNESELHERLAAAIGRSEGNPLYVISQKTLTGHAKGGAAAFQLIGLSQVLTGGVVPPNRSLDCVMDDLAEHEHLVWLREPLATGQLKAGLVTSLGFGHVAGLIALVNPQAFLATLTAEERDSYATRAEARTIGGRMRLVRAMYGGPSLYERPDRRLGSEGVRAREAAMLLDPQARLGEGDIYQSVSCQ